jgi:2-amino-4-hydroxy-6-hydroxymethyldihydropteridine diphosphokinase
LLSPKPVSAFIGVGSNLNDPPAQVRSAITAMGRVCDWTVESQSSLYVSRPMGPPDQPNYVNAVVQLSTELSCLALLSRLQDIETAHGRVHSDIHWGPRVLDLDILIFGEFEFHTGKLTVPHPGILQRPFVVVPLAEIAPDLILPNGIAATDMVRNLTCDELQRIDNE